MTHSARPRPSLFAAACLAVALSAAAASAAPAVVPLTLPSGKVLQVEVMVRDEDRAMGLMFRPSLPQDRGLLFVFDAPDFHGFWMKNCRFPIDMVWLDEQKRVVHVAEAVPPCKADPCPVYEPLRKASYVVELNAGQARRERAVLGATVSFALPR
jgi:uncharacterized membrane protein (UPF0127 family)